MSESTHGVVVKNIRKSYGKLNVLKGVDLKIGRGTILALLGPNGAGKTTMVRILTVFIPPAAYMFRRKSSR